jgi:4-aminobutyrate---pyruvate transaminase
MTLEQTDIQTMLHPFTNFKAHEASGPFVIEKGEGIYVYDNKGNKYLDAMSGLWCVSLGYSNERLIKAATDQYNKLPFYHIFNHKSHPKAIELSEKILSIMPSSPSLGKMTRVCFANSGSEANDTAIKLMWLYNNALGRPHKKKIISRHLAYHGVTALTGSLTGMPSVQGPFDLPLQGILHTDCPHYYRFGLEGESEEEFTNRIVQNLEDLILREGAETIAAMIVEPIMGAGGVLIPPEGYFEKIQKVLRRHDILLIVDEVICGFYRTGELFGSLTYNIQPDMVVMAKGLSSAYTPISALAMPEALYKAIFQKVEEFGVFGHGFTNAANPVSAAIALEAINIYMEKDLSNHVKKLGGIFHEGLQQFKNHSLVGNVRSKGLLAGIELVQDKASKTPFDLKKGVQMHAMNAAQSHGVIIRAIGNHLVMCPPLISQESDIHRIVETVGKALHETEKWLSVA